MQLQTRKFSLLEKRNRLPMIVIFKVKTNIILAVLLPPVMFK